MKTFSSEKLSLFHFEIYWFSISILRSRTRPWWGLKLTATSNGKSAGDHSTKSPPVWRESRCFHGLLELNWVNGKWKTRWEEIALLFTRWKMGICGRKEHMRRSLAEKDSRLLCFQTWGKVFIFFWLVLKWIQKRFVDGRMEFIARVIERILARFQGNFHVVFVVWKCERGMAWKVY